MNVLVTGGAGFIGSNLIDALILENHTVAAVDNFSTGKRSNLNVNARLYEMDICNQEQLDAVLRDFRPEVICHHAAQIDVQTSITKPDFDAAVNVVGTVSVLEAARRAGVRKVVYASSAAVYGEPQYLAIDEAHPVEPISAYGISKHTPEHYLKLYAKLYAIEYTILRYANVYGIRQDPKGEGGVVSIFVDKLLSDETAVIFGDGSQTRDFIYVKDIVRANLLALNAGASEIINIGTGIATSVKQLFDVMAEVSGCVVSPSFEAPRKGDILHSYFTIAKASEVLKWSPEYDLHRGLEETIAHYREEYGSK